MMGPTTEKLDHTMMSLTTEKLDHTMMGPTTEKQWSDQPSESLIEEAAVLPEA